MDEETCKTCKFCLVLDPTREDDGICRRFPPIPWLPELGDGDEPEAWVHPPVFDYGWCGEWQAIESTT